MLTPAELHDALPDGGFRFPGDFELSAMGAADAGLERELPELLQRAGIELLPDRLSVRSSSAGRYVSVRIGFRAQSREQYEAAHALLRSHPGVKWTV